MATLWERRELPLLKVIADFDSSSLRPGNQEIYDGLEDEGRTLPLEEIMAGLVALAEAEPPYIRVNFMMVDLEVLPVRALDVRLTERGVSNCRSVAFRGSLRSAHEAARGAH